MSPADIAPCIPSPRGARHLDLRSVEKVADFWNDFGHVLDVGYVTGRPVALPEDHVLLLKRIVKMAPWLYLDEIAQKINKKRGVMYPVSTINDTLRREKLSLKVMRRKAQQRCEAHRDWYWDTIADTIQYPWEVCFADEVGQDGRTSRRKKGRGPRGEFVEITEPLRYQGKHISILALFGYEGFIDFDWLEGGYKAGDFMSAVEYMVIPHLRPYSKAHPQPNSVFVVDNCQIHHKYEAELRQMVESVGAKLIFLAPYSPIDTPIELGFNAFKAFWRRHGPWMRDLPVHEAIHYSLFHCFEDPLAAAAEQYRKCGY